MNTRAPAPIVLLVAAAAVAWPSPRAQERADPPPVVVGKGRPILDCARQTANRPCIHARFAGFVDQSLPENMLAAQSYPVTVTFRNTGDDTWTTADGLALTPADAETAAAFGPVTVPLPTSVVPDQEVTFTFQVTAAVAPGSYNVSFRLQQNAAPFGAPTAQVAITVQ